MSPDGEGHGASGSGSAGTGSGASSGGSQSGASGATPDITDRSAWKDKSFTKFKFDTGRNMKVRVTLKTNIGGWGEGENFQLYATTDYCSYDVVATVHKNYDSRGKWDGTGWFEKDLESGVSYYVLSKENGSAFTITNVEVIE